MFRKRRQEQENERKTERTWGSGTPESPDYWLAWISPSAASGSESSQRSLSVLAPQFVRRQRFGRDVELVLQVADAAAYETGHRVLFFSGANRWLRASGRAWGDVDVDWESALEQLDRAVVIDLNVDDITYAVAAGATHMVVQDETVEVDDDQRAAVRARVQAWLTREWPEAIRRLRG